MVSSPQQSHLQRNLTCACNSLVFSASKIATFKFAANLSALPLPPSQLPIYFSLPSSLEEQLTFALVLEAQMRIHFV